mmetsp:Transcript_21590/g.50376  ORF Transcript_21590/g.50376 Transcript_21590/m.50376 type:complete len:542 (-) Transcript_21590:8-1633(-)
MMEPAALERLKGLRSNRSKKQLPAAFSTRTGRQRDASAGKRDGGNRADAQQISRVQPPLPLQLSADEPAIRLDALVFLCSCPQRHSHAAMKKMLYPATLELFCLMEIPGAEPQRQALRSHLEAWLRSWCALQEGHPNHLVAVCETYWNVPQGYPVGILCEYMPLGSLDDLIQACGGLPEEAMREIAQAVLEALAALHTASPPMVHGCVKPSQVLFTADGRTKLTFGLEQRLKACQPGIHHPGGAAPAVADPLSARRADVEEECAEGGVSSARGADRHVHDAAATEQSVAVDIFDLGLLLLVSALGGFDVLLDAIPYAREFGSKNHAQANLAPLNAQDTCSLLRRELNSDPEGLFGQSAAFGQGSSIGYLPAASDLLFNRRYSEAFLAFVSTCLEAHQQSAPVTASELLGHEFLRTQFPAGPVVSLREMQDLSRQLNEAPTEEREQGRRGPARSRSLVPGVAPSVTQSAKLYIANIVDAISPRVRQGAAVRDGPRDSSRSQSQDGEWGQCEWETLVIDTAHTLGLPYGAVQSALESQLRLLT